MKKIVKKNIRKMKKIMRTKKKMKRNMIKKLESKLKYLMILHIISNKGNLDSGLILNIKNYFNIAIVKKITLHTIYMGMSTGVEIGIKKNKKKNGFKNRSNLIGIGISVDHPLITVNINIFFSTNGNTCVGRSMSQGNIWKNDLRFYLKGSNLINAEPHVILLNV